METGNELLQHLGIAARPVSGSGLGTLDFYRHAESGNFQLWGALGADGDAHLEHLRYMGQFLTHLPLAKLTVPEPTSCWLLALGLFALLTTGARR